MGDLDGMRARVSRTATRAAAIATGTRLSDPMSGYFVISQQAFIDALPKLSNVGFKVLLDLLLSSPRTLTVVEYPYCFRSRTAGVSKLDSLVVAQFLAMLIEKRIGRWAPMRLVMFLSVGALGMLVHLATLKSGIALAGMDFDHAQIAAVIVAIAFNFFLNNIFTYRDLRLKGWRMVRGLMSFYLVCGFGALANAGIADLLFTTGHSWWAAGLAGAGIGALWNYAASSFLTWQSS
jgi:dolichol-phosphate mannosyltransferase